MQKSIKSESTSSVCFFFLFLNFTFVDFSNFLQHKTTFHHTNKQKGNFFSTKKIKSAAILFVIDVRLFANILVSQPFLLLHYYIWYINSRFIHTYNETAVLSWMNRLFLCLLIQLYVNLILLICLLMKLWDQLKFVFVLYRFSISKKMNVNTVKYYC